MTTKVGKNLRNVYDTVALAKADPSLRVGEKVETLGYYSVNDGGGATYVVVAPATGTDDGGSYHDLDSGVGQLELIVTDSSVDPRTFGAKDDGVTDNTSYFQAALDTGYNLTLGANSGSYYVGSNVVTSANGQQIKGKGLVTISTDLSTGELISLGFADSVVDSIKLVNTNGRSTGSCAGIVISGSRCTVENCQATGFANVGIGTETGTINAKIVNNICYDNKSGISIYRSTQCEVKGNICYQNGTTGGVGGGILLFGDATQNVKRVVCSDNVCVDNYTHGISGEAINRSIISSNVCENNGTAGLGAGSGIAILTTGASAVSSENAINDNQCSANSDHGIVIQNNVDATTITPSCTISGNICHSNQKTGIRLINRMDNFAVTGNTCYNNGQSGSSVGERHGIWLAQGITRCNVTGNNCYTNTDDGIRVSDEGLAPVPTDAGSGENNIQGNILRLNGAYGINLYTDTVASVANSVVDNQMRQNTSGDIGDSHTNTYKSGNRFTFDKVKGTATLSSGTATVNTSEIQTGDLVNISITNPVNTGYIYVSSITDSTSFTLTSTDVADGSTVVWEISH